MLKAIHATLDAFIAFITNILNLAALRVEVKWFKGRFLPYGKPIDPNATAFDNAIAYVNDPRHADFYAFPCITRGGKSRPGKVHLALYKREVVLDAITAFQKSGACDYGALGLHNGGVALLRAEELTIRQTFGQPELLIYTGMNKRDDLKPDASCTVAPFARAWEKVCAALLGAKWIGGLRNVQIDLIVNLNDD